MRVNAIGYGAGQRQTGDRPNVMRMLVGEHLKKKAQIQGTHTETLTLIETNIDDQTPEEIAFQHEKLMAIPGVLDAHIVTSQMKKGRMGFLLRVLCRHDAVDKVEIVLFAESSTLGIRSWPVVRVAKNRMEQIVKTEYGDIRMKVTSDHAAPEYEDCRIAAEKQGVPLKNVMEAARRAFQGVRKV